MKDYEKKQEFYNASTHWLGVIAACLCTGFLLVNPIKNLNISKIVSFSIYGLSFLLMYLASALYHTVREKNKKKILRVFDHASIFLFIAGSYTPICLLSFEGTFRIFSISLIWIIAIFGVVFKVLTYGKFESTKKVSLTLYLIMGWISVFMLKAIFDSTSLFFVLLLLLGGILYSLGTIFYANKKIPYNHAIWHLFVLAGTLVHFGGIYNLYG